VGVLATIDALHGAWPHSQSMSEVSPCPSQYVLQYVLPSLTSHVQLGCLHFFDSAMEHPPACSTTEFLKVFRFFEMAVVGVIGLATAFRWNTVSPAGAVPPPPNC
jgi:hypothetical protein